MKHDRQDYEIALRLIAEQGDAAAQFDLGDMYTEGRGVTQDHKEAAKWFRLITDQGDAAAAQFDLGDMYAEGRCVTQDYKEAVKWFRLAAD